MDNTQTETSSLIKDLPDLSQYTRQILEHFNFEVHQKEDFESTTIAHDIDSSFFIGIIKIFDGKIDEGCDILKKTPIQNSIEYLQKTHRYYIKKRLFEIEQAIDHAFKFPEITLLIKNEFLKAKKNLIDHIGYEEKHLFPHLTILSLGNLSSNFKLQDYIASHDVEVEHQIKTLIQKIKLIDEPGRERLTYDILLKALTTFEIELNVHAIVEDQVLIPQGILLENDKGAY